MEIDDKALTLLLDAVQQATMTLSIADIVHDRLLAGVAKGRGEMDWTALSTLVTEDTGME